MQFTNIVYGTHERNILDLCLPKNKSGNVGLILFVHGGGWISGDKSDYWYDMQYWCNSQGYITASINHRYANGDNITIDEILNDITASLNKIKEVALANNFDIQKVMLCGFSSGAHLSLMYAYKNLNNSPVKPVAVASFSAPTDLTDKNYNKMFFAEDINFMISNIAGVEFKKLYSEKTIPALLDTSPVNFISNLSVPTIICHGLYDNVVPYSNAQKLNDKLTKAGVKHDFITFSNSSHGLENDNDCWKKANETMLIYAKQFLD